MPTLKLINGRLVPYTDEGAVEPTLEAWRESAVAERGRRALILPNDADLAEIAPTIARFDAVILEFPSFGDGRAYSQARLLRGRYAYRGEIRARGEILRDQIFFMARAGVDVFEVAEDAGVAEALGEFSFVYQPAADGAPPVWRLRRRRAAAA